MKQSVNKCENKYKTCKRIMTHARTTYLFANTYETKCKKTDDIEREHGFY